MRAQRGDAGPVLLLEAQTGGGKPQWLPVRVEETASASAGPILVRVGAAAIEVRQGFDPSLLAEVVRALKTLC